MFLQKKYLINDKLDTLYIKAFKKLNVKNTTVELSLPDTIFFIKKFWFVICFIYISPLPNFAVGDRSRFRDHSTRISPKNSRTFFFIPNTCSTFAQHVKHVLNTPELLKTCPKFSKRKKKRPGICIEFVNFFPSNQFDRIWVIGFGSLDFIIKLVQRDLNALNEF